MDEMNQLSSSEFVEAVRLWTGWDRMAPCRDDARVVQRFGHATADKLIPIMQSLIDDFFASDAIDRVSSLSEVTVIASQQFKRKHPTVSDDVVKEFARLYAFAHK